ncbi:hypothetical protein ANN_19904 [Periplaneta americana]|uniref:Laccase n=1 Tax=Periplaneta americana TaxID=6978 RepID=A0ABQ8SB54_PERAM|nr:hypothetical protein ANN_19904 [Periplaneta americana]
MRFLQPDDVDLYYYLPQSNETHLCTRECQPGDHRICYYKFVLTNYAVLSAACGKCTEVAEDCDHPQCIIADGYEKSVLTANRRVPGPVCLFFVQVCYGDRIIVDLVNKMFGKSIAIHWHGLEQINKPFMDGVPYVAQCPVPDGATFRYDFMADTVGTMYWHSHAGLHKLNGLQGSLIIRQPKDNDPVDKLYDYDLPAHVIVIMDWYHTQAEARFPGLIHHDSTQDTTFYIISGRGKFTPVRFFIVFNMSYESFAIQGESGGKQNNRTTSTPYREFVVKPGFRYRFRVIGALGTQCPALLQVEGHRLQLIATDGNPVVPLFVDSLEIYSGERYDFVLYASEKTKCYWIQVRGLQNCFRRDVCQMAVLRYEGSKEKGPSSPRPTLRNFSFRGVVLNPEDASCGPGQTGVCISQLESLNKIDKRIYSNNPDYNIEIKFGFHGPSVEELFLTESYPRYVQATSESLVIPWINRIQMKTPASPLQTQFSDIPEGMFCPNDTDGMPTCPADTKDYCTCVPTIKIPLNSLVQFVLIDKPFRSLLNHPFHLHGSRFHVMSMGYLPDNLMNAKDINELLKKNKLPMSSAPTFKDTIAVPSGGYAVIRFIATNPGFWFFHCHFAYHLEGGMSTVIQVGKRSEFSPTPEGFPKCGDYIPNIKATIHSEHKSSPRRSYYDVHDTEVPT